MSSLHRHNVIVTLHGDLEKRHEQFALLLRHSAILHFRLVNVSRVACLRDVVPYIASSYFKYDYFSKLLMTNYYQKVTYASIIV